MLASSRRLPFGPACSLFLILAIVARLFVSFLPCESWGPSGYLCAATYLKLPLGSTHTSVANAAIPEGARLSNRLEFLSFRQERFTLDERGYRNQPGVNRPRAVLIGSSYSLGLALNDEDTFSTRLNEQLGPVVYNASGILNPDLSADEQARIARESGMDQGWIVVEVLNRESFSYRQPSFASSFRNVLDRAMAPEISFVRQIVHGYALTRISTLFNMRVHDGRILPNPFAAIYSEEQLINGRRVLMYSDDKNFSQKPDSPSVTAAALLRLRDELNRRGYHLAVFLLPNAYSVYYPLLRNHTVPDASEEYMRGLANQLTTEAVPTLNLLPILREDAVAELNGGRVIYYSDDAHWNALGVKLAARAVAPWLKSLLEGEVASGQ